MTPSGETKDGEDTFAAAQKLDELSDQQRREVQSKSRPNAALIHETIRAEGLSELERGAFAVLASALAAGLSIGFSLILEGNLHANLPQGPLRELVSPLGYTLGFLIVVMGRQQLFTENTLTPVLPLLHDPSREMFGQVMRLWGLVLLGNLVGTWVVAAAIAFSGVFDAHLLEAFTEISRKTVEADFGLTFARAVFAGWLIALMVWLLPASGGSRVLVIIIITYVVSMAGFAHVVAGAVECALLVWTGQASIGDFVFRFFLPTLTGNIVGGITLVAFLNYAQVSGELED
jgi:formate/nitrite transporter FocA (FNT family)